MKARWGTVIFIVSLVLIAGVYLFIQRYPHERSLKLYTSVFPALCVTFSVLSFFIGHFSYPRVQNLKVYLLGYLTGLTGISFILYSLFIESPQNLQTPISESVSPPQDWHLKRDYPFIIYFCKSF